MRTMTPESAKETRERIELNDLEMCALDVSFENLDNIVEVLKIRKKFPSAYTDSKNAYFKGNGAMGLDKLTFNDFFVTIQDLLVKERANLEQMDTEEILPCGHNAVEHITALNSAIKKTE